MRTITVGKELPVASPGLIGTGLESGYQGSRFWDDVGRPHLTKNEADSLPVGGHVMRPSGWYFRRSRRAWYTNIVVRDLTRVLQ